MNETRIYQPQQIMLIVPAEEWNEQKERTERIERLLEEQKNKQSSQDGWLTTKEAAEYLGVAVRTLQDYRDKRRLPYSQIDKTIRYKVSDIDKFLEEHYITKINYNNDENRNN